MPTEPLVLEVVAPEEQKALLAVVQQNGLPPDAAVSLQSSFAPAFTEAHTILTQSRAIIVTDGSQKLQIKLARECRLALKAIRVSADKTRKELKDESLRRGRAVDGFYNILLDLTETEEKRLADQEDFVERQEAARKEALKTKRSETLVALSIDPALYQLGEMTEDSFQTLVEGTKLARVAQAEAARKAEAERIAKEASEAAERERIRVENERLKAEAAEKEKALATEREAAAKERAELEAKAKAEREAAEAAAAAERQRVAEEQRVAAEKARVEREAIEEAARKDKARLQAVAEAARKKAEAAAKEAAEKAKAEREAAEALAAKERAAREKLEAEDRQRRELEAAAEAERIAAAKKAAAAPDKEKLAALAAAIRALEIPDLSTVEAIPLIAEIGTQREKFAQWIEKRAGAL